MEDIEFEVCSCKLCKQDPVVAGLIKFHPVYSFGGIDSKRILFVGLNPSRREYLNSHLPDIPSVESRRESQLNYFERKPYRFFSNVAELFGGEVQKLIGWKNHPWEKVGFIDLVKCPTVKTTKSGREGQWSSLTKRERETIVSNCDRYLIRQLMVSRPTLIIAYGRDVCCWFRSSHSKNGLSLFPQMDCISYSKILIQKGAEEFFSRVVFLMQSQARFTASDIEKIRSDIVAAFQL